MKRLLAILLFIPGLLSGQTLGDYDLVVEEITGTSLPGLQSFVVGQASGKWLVLGGRTDGLHRRQPWATFWESENNKTIYVIDPSTGQVWADSLSKLPTPMYEQLQCTNMSFEQIGDYLYIVGGYGYSNTAADHVTHPYLTVVNVPAAILAITTGQNPSAHFRQVQDARVQVTGSYLEEIDGEFFLVGGQKFMGLYNPMGPTHGPGFFQEYTNQIRRFTIDDSAGIPVIRNYSAVTDTVSLHRRDYNLVAQVFPGGQPGLTAFSGVFQYGVDLPWLNTVDITPSGYTVNNTFSQYLNQYHTAHMAAFDAGDTSMYTVFFGGISRYTVDTAGNLIDDQDVPFVNTVSMVQRFGNGSMQESKIGEMPALLGSGAEFIPIETLPRWSNEVLKIDQLQSDSVLCGYVYGGIQSSQPNIFFINTGTQSSASGRLFKVWLVKDANTGIEPQTVTAGNYFRLEAFPNPAEDILTIRFRTLKEEKVKLYILDNQGRMMDVVLNDRIRAGVHEFPLDISFLPAGMFHLVVGNAEYRTSIEIIHR